MEVKVKVVYSISGANPVDANPVGANPVDAYQEFPSSDKPMEAKSAFGRGW